MNVEDFWDPLENRTRKIQNVICIVDDSEYMKGSGINDLNSFMEETVRVLQTCAKDNINIEIRMILLKVSGTAQSIPSAEGVNIEYFRWKSLPAQGGQKLGRTLQMLDFLGSAVQKAPSAVFSVNPILLFAVNGHSDDDFEIPLIEIQKNPWFRDAVKIGIAVGENPDITAIAEITGDKWEVTGSDSWNWPDKLAEVLSYDGPVWTSAAIPGRNELSEQTDSFEESGSAFAQAGIRCSISCSNSDSESVSNAEIDKVEEPVTNAEIDKVEFSAVAPRVFVKNEYSIVEIYMYEEMYRHIVDELIFSSSIPLQEAKGGFAEVRDRSKVKVVLDSPDLAIEKMEEERVWYGGYVNFSFALMLPEDYRKSQIFFRAEVYINGVIAARLKFIANCVSAQTQEIAVVKESITSAFISYASQDRRKVAMIVQGMKKARPDMDVFFDVESLHSGEYWEKSLKYEIEKRDILFLFWSHFAKESPWVDAEWRYALENKGIEGVEPVPIEPPGKCPPPEELKRKHFNDNLLYIINSPWEEDAPRKECECGTRNDGGMGEDTFCKDFCREDLSDEDDWFR